VFRRAKKSVSSKIPQNEYTERVQYGAAFVFLSIVMGSH